MRRRALTTIFVFAWSAAAGAQTVRQVQEILEEPTQAPEVVEYQLRQYLMNRVPTLPTPGDPKRWSQTAHERRQRLLEDSIFHGWPRYWVDSPPNFTDQGIIATGKGYQIQKLSYEIVPGFWTSAFLYEPEHMTGRAPAILIFEGHNQRAFLPEEQQRLSVNYVRRGMLALNLTWFNCGQLFTGGEPYTPKNENAHWNGSYMNLAGTSATGLFYLAARKGLDYLAGLPNVDPHRLGATGLSGGAWQTIILSALDERVTAAVPVSGYFAFASAIERNGDVGDMEYNPPDFDADYTLLTALRAPRPTLLIYGSEDPFYVGRAPFTKPYLYDQILPFYQLYHKEDSFEFHANPHPVHSYDEENRKESYRFFSQHFGLPPVSEEIPVDIINDQTLSVNLPTDNLTILRLARNLADKIKREAVPSDASSRGQWTQSRRQKLEDVVRYHPQHVKHAWGVANSKNGGLEAETYRLEFVNGLSASATWLQPTGVQPGGSATIVLQDEGRSHAAQHVTDLLSRGEKLLTVDLLFTGDASPDRKGSPRANDHVLIKMAEENEHNKEWLVNRPPSVLYTQLLESMARERSIGLEAAQLIGAASWLKDRSDVNELNIDTYGIRSQVVAMVAAALEPDLFRQLTIRGGTDSLKYLFSCPITIQEAPELFSRDFYKEFDLDQLKIIASPTRLDQSEPRPCRITDP
jgi:dienelactone hydrolase